MRCIVIVAFAIEMTLGNMPANPSVISTSETTK